MEGHGESPSDPSAESPSFSVITRRHIIVPPSMKCHRCSVLSVQLPALALLLALAGIVAAAYMIVDGGTSRNTSAPTVVRLGIEVVNISVYNDTIIDRYALSLHKPLLGADGDVRDQNTGSNGEKQESVIFTNGSNAPDFDEEHHEPTKAGPFILPQFSPYNEDAGTLDGNAAWTNAEARPVTPTEVSERKLELPVPILFPTLTPVVKEEEEKSQPFPTVQYKPEDEETSKRSRRLHRVNKKIWIEVKNLGHYFKLRSETNKGGRQ